MKTRKEQDDLTKREMEVLTKMADGHTQKEIAELLYVSRHTVNTHQQNIYEKLEVHTGTHAIAKAFRAQMID